MKNVAAEGLLLGGLLRNIDSFFMFVDRLEAEDFTYTPHEMIYEVMREGFLNKGLDKLSKTRLFAEAKTLGFDNFMSATKDGAVVDGVMSHQVSAREIPDLYLQVKRASLIRNYGTSFSGLMTYLKDTQDPASEIITHIEKEVYAQTNRVDQGEDIINLAEIAFDIIDELAENPGELGLDVGLKEWQRRIGGIRNGTITFIAATAKTGKSQFGMDLARRVARYLGLPVLLIDTELSPTEQVIRMVGMEAKIPYDVMETGYWKLSNDELRAQEVPEDDIKKIAEYRQRLKDPILRDKVKRMSISYIQVSGTGIEQAIPKMRRWLMSKVKPDPESKFPQCLIIYDYLKLASADEIKGGKIPEWQLHGLNLALMHDFVKEFHVPMVMFGQTNKEIDTNFHCIAGGKRVVENTDSISLLKRKTLEEVGFDPTGNILMRVFGARHGAATPVGHINLDVKSEYWEMEERGYSSIDFGAERAKKLEEWKKKKYKRKGDDDDDWDNDD